jgi:methionyl-tRNA formyltransferase
MRILFAGTPEIAVPCLQTLIAGDEAWTLAGVLTNPDRPKGRSGKPEPSPVAAFVEEFLTTNHTNLTNKSNEKLPVLKPESLKEQAREDVAALKPDLLVSFAYGRLFGPKFMALFPLGGINVHPSLLPKYRGPSPIQEAILRGDTVTGVSIQKIAPAMDTGDILAVKEIPLDGRETAESLGARVAEIAAPLLAQTLKDIARPASIGEEPAGRHQQGEASYCSLIEKDSGRIDWNRSAREIDAQIRAYTPWPLARTGHKGQILYILEALPLSGDAGGSQAELGQTVPGQVLGKDPKNGILIQTGDGILAVSRLQYRARKALPAGAFLNGARDFIGSRLVSEE